MFQTHTPPHLPARQPARQSTPDAEPCRGKVLVVDDELAVVRVYERALTANGFRVLTATDGETAEVMFRRCAFDAVISDVSMPGMDGIKLVRALRRIDPDVPIILATGEHADDVARRAVEEGAVMFLTKPVDMRALSQVTAHAIELRRAAARRCAAAEPREGRAGAPDPGLTAHFDAALGKLWIAYQPIVCWTTLATVGYEALARSDEPALADPALLFAAAERLGRTLELGRALRALIAAGIPDAPPATRIFVNLHPQELADDTLYSAQEPLHAHAGRVVLEITERESLACVPDLSTRIDALRAAGFGIAVDDLGAGYAGLSSFSQLKPNVVKLDMSLTRNIDKVRVNRQIVQAMSLLCRDMGIELIAEGVETEEERQTLGFLGCQHQQGFAYARPHRGFARPPSGAPLPEHATA
jgi:EAL domain-containing protein (putative c-di-GMP-specific phosphodiesterase class I)